MNAVHRVNPTFSKALALLAHPLSLGAVALLLVNDHVLRRLAPGWWTGKLGDFAWLVFFPFVLAAALAWLPIREPTREKWVFGMAFGITGAGFALLKTNPAWMDGFLRIASDGFNTRFVLVADPADLLALPGLFISCALWAGRSNLSGFPNLTGFWSWTPRSKTGLLLLPIAALLTVANSGAPDYGIQCFGQSGERIVAEAGYAAYGSSDGGETWQALGPGEETGCVRDDPAADGQWIEANGPREGVVYRYRPGAEIEISEDGGATWQMGFQPGGVSEAEQAYRMKQNSLAVFEAGPLDTFADPERGSMLFAMSQQGVLIHRSNGTWAWADILAYAPVGRFPTTDAAVLLLGSQGYLAVGLALLLLSTFLLRWTKVPLRIGVLVLAWLGWLATGILFPPATSYGYSATLTIFGILGVGMLIIPLLIEQSIRLARKGIRVPLLPLAGLALLGGLLYLLPYALWMFSTLPSMTWATGFGLAIAAAALILGLTRYNTAL